MLFLLLFIELVFSQSFPEKPVVPVFHVGGKRVVRVDCWGVKDELKTFYLNETNHPQVFSSRETLPNLDVMSIQVSLLRSENTLSISVMPKSSKSLEVNTYGTDCGLSIAPHNIYCSVFDGELSEN